MQLKDTSLFRQQAWINGEWTQADSGATTKIYNPSNNELIGEVPNLGQAETRRAIQAAEAAMPAWQALTAKERGNCLRKWFDLMMENQEDLGRIMTLEQGKPFPEAKGEIAYAASFVEWFAEEAKRVNGETLPGHQPDKRILVIKQAIGVAAAITPWNFPAAMITRKVAPALAAGCAMVVKPAPQTPFSALALAELAQRAGIPAGILNILPADVEQSREVGAELCANPTVRKLSFTGSTAVGSKLMEQCAPSIKKLSLELGGNAPFIVFDDADLDAAVEGAMLSKYRNAGQTCVCANRIYVQEGVYEAFTEKLSAAVKKLKVGDGFEEGVSLGPLINQQAVDKVNRHLEDALSKGAKIHTGGEAHPKGGTFMSPTIITGTTQDMLLASEETFGPLAPLFKFKDEAEVIQQANDTEFGLAAYFYAKDLSRVWKTAEALEYGMVGINTGIISTEIAPFGGVKASGLGREGSHHGIEEYLEMKYLCMSV
ncbi:succinate-semialdehyde dehydrogenase / glutarate-semialdehyde dehydrogenase [Marinospirillum celere]|uniref:Succinate-semialdehyde dehydrogenase / glutarate-semialdehyde dehydrogenase n=1 Tax=Marinospirillum celere TaxID=1122252 RepID=A0A1I1GAE7_9GAMM|nr:NADP-dependent succinate-semialdehyde dehydrogenase [Marinospirillum celere]SFC06110.1 succinate-semialdehyde dehydrogenase / glutarate-semialdehyde dehydrogenase [Marinospirillum celere]